MLLLMKEPDMAGSTRRAAGSAILKRVGAAYDHDFYSWSQEQGQRVREGRWSEVDRENVAEEIESLGREQFNKLESAIRVLLIHMLKWDHQPGRESRSWSGTIAAQRIELEHVLGDNPGLRPRIDEAIARAYRRARLEAAQETELSLKSFPVTCPYSFDDITSRPFPFE
jgi:hypothetical protein